MSVDSIGSKIMLQRVTDFAKDASVELKRNDLMSSAMQKQMQTEAERQAAEVVHVHKVEHAKIQLERERDRRGGRQDKGEHNTKKQPDIETDPQKARTKLPEVGASERKFDIHV